MTAVAIIPARGGSKRILRKNIKFFHGKPIIAYSIEAAKASGLFSRIWVSTDDDVIARIAEGYGASSVMRPSEFAIDEVGTQAVAKQVLEWLRDEDDLPEYACVIYATAPLMLPEDLRYGFRAIQKPNTDFAYSVRIDPFEDAGQWYWGRSRSFLDNVPLDPDSWSVMKVVIPKERVCDINTEDDWRRAEQMYAALHPEVIA